MNELKGIPHIVTIRFKIVVVQNGVLGQLPPGQIAPNPKTNCNPNRIEGGGGNFPRGQLSGYRRTVPFQSNPSELSIRLAIVWNSHFSEQPIFRIATVFFKTAAYRSSCQRCVIIKIFFKISQYSQENTCVGGLQGCNFIEKRLQHSCFPVNIAKI